MARKPTGNPVGRPKTEINWEQFEQLCSLHCTSSEIASFLKLNVDTLRIRAKDFYGEEYPDIYKRYKEQGNCSLRRDQRVLAKTNASMAIWLGKVVLGQRDPDMIESNQSKVAFEEFNKNMERLLPAIADKLNMPSIPNIQAPIKEVVRQHIYTT